MLVCKELLVLEEVMYISNRWRGIVVSALSSITIYIVCIRYIAGMCNLFSLGALSITQKSTGYYLCFLSPHLSTSRYSAAKCRQRKQ